jgi:hypothetical protein
MYSNITGVVFETDCEIGRPSGSVQGNNLSSICTEPGSPNLPTGETVSVKAGILSPSDFSGTPRVATVTFDDAYADTNYIISLSGEDARIFTYQSKAVDGFVVNTNANGALTGEVSWFVTRVGEL